MQLILSVKKGSNKHERSKTYDLILSWIDPTSSRTTSICSTHLSISSRILQHTLAQFNIHRHMNKTIKKIKSEASAYAIQVSSHLDYFN